jgi:hypothetical protein
MMWTLNQNMGQKVEGAVRLVTAGTARKISSNGPTRCCTISARSETTTKF